MQRNRQNHLRLQQSHTHFVMLRKVHNFAGRFPLRLNDRIRVLVLFRRRCRRSTFRLLRQQNFFALKSHRHLNAANGTARKVQRSHNVLAQFVRRFEQTESTDATAFVRNEIKVRPSSCRYVLQVVQSDLEFRFGFAFFQEGVGRRQFFVGFVAQGWHIVRTDDGGQRQNTNRYAQNLHFRSDPLRCNGQFVEIFDSDATVRGWTGYWKHFFVQICGKRSFRSVQFFWRGSGLNLHDFDSPTPNRRSQNRIFGSVAMTTFPCP